MTFGKTSRSDSAKEITTALLMAVAIVGALTLLNIWLASKLSEGLEVNKVTAGRLPKTVQAAAPCEACRAAGGCKCCVCPK